MKKFRTMMLVCLSVMMLAGAQSAFATTGVYDGPATAKNSLPGNVYTGYIDSSTDSDWFVVANPNASGSVVVYPVLVCPSGVNLDIDVLWVHKDGTVDKDSYNQAGAGGIEGSSNIGWGVGPNDLLYFRVHGHSASDFSSSKSYTFIFN
ncbi:hypothetical protein [Cohnella sp. AR92]|uniref:hypothetical protein n=1 Tax=Cohnella sp. AR92 TaxID=648716 RepID=UPI000F8EBE8F|nr:hypothetical protein [Cohnella sp. AR92]RUS48383.1 hypothetical protein ELR57_02890 [Cohnella sp. AR92]